MEKKTAKQIKDLWLGDNIENAMEEYAQQQTPTKEILSTIEIAYRKGVLNGANGNTDIAKPFLILSQATAFEIFKASRLNPDNVKSTPSPVEGEKEELENKYRAYLRHIKTPAIDRHFDQKIFDFFYYEIEARASRIKALEERLDDIDTFLASALPHEDKGAESTDAVNEIFQGIETMMFAAFSKGKDNDGTFFQWYKQNEMTKLFQSSLDEYAKIYASNERNRAIQECIDVIEKLRVNAHAAPDDDYKAGYKKAITNFKA